MPQIQLERRNPLWATEFLAAKASLETILTSIPIISIEHIGSTSIPDLLAKPIIDIDIEISPVHFEAVKDALVTAGYTWIGESGIPGRHAFWQPGSVRGFPQNAGERRRNTYVCFEGCLSLRNHRDLKRILMEDAALRREYGERKKELVYEEEVEDVEEYCAGKNKVVRKILRSAGWSEEDLDVVQKLNMYARGMMR